jgi:hypothetical protein
LSPQILERALSTGDDASVFNICNKIVELLDPEQSSQLYSVVCDAGRYRGLHRAYSDEKVAVEAVTNAGGTGGVAVASTTDGDGEYHTGVGAVVQAALGAEVAGLATEMVGVFGSVFGISRSKQSGCSGPSSGNGTQATPLKPSPPSSSSGAKTPGTAIKNNTVSILYFLTRM